MNDILPGLGELPEFGAQDSLFAFSGAPRQVGSTISNPVARVHLEMPQPHMDRVFDYLVPEKLDDAARVGARVIVPVGTAKASGYIVARTSVTHTGGKLRGLHRVVSPLPVLSPSIYAAALQLARRNAGSVGDILRFAIPSRHARTERAYREEFGGFTSCAETPENSLETYTPPTAVPGAEPASSDTLVSRDARDRAAWLPYLGGEAFVNRVEAGESPRAICVQLPEVSRSFDMVLAACRSARLSGRGVLILFPTHAEAAEAAAVCEKHFGTSVQLMTSHGDPASRYRAFLRVRGGQAPIVIGTRAAVWAPVVALGLVVLYDDAADTYREVRAPYYESRDVLALRASVERAAFLLISPYMSVPSAAMVRSGWAAPVESTPSVARASLPRVSSPEQWVHEETLWHRIPDAAFEMVRERLTAGPVLVVVPHSGYFPVVACSHCRQPASCPDCGGALAVDSPESPARCRICGNHPKWRCPHCHHTTLSAVRVGSHRTAEEIGKAFPGVGIILSGAQSPDGISRSVSTRSRIVVATPGSEPWADAGFAGALVLDSRFLLGNGADAETTFLRHATRVVSRVVPASSGGHVMFAGGIDPRLLDTVAHWSFSHYASDVLTQREGLHLPPAARWLAVTGAPHDVKTFLGLLRGGLGSTHSRSAVREPYGTDSADVLLASGVHHFAEGVDILGPIPAPRDELTIYLRSPLSYARELTVHARSAHRSYSAQRLGAPIRLEVDPRM